MPSFCSGKRVLGFGELGLRHAQLHGLLHRCMYNNPVAKTIQIRDVDDEVYAALVRRAAEERVSVPELLRQEAARLAARPSLGEWLRQTRRRSSQVTRADLLTDLDESRGPWPDARR